MLCYQKATNPSKILFPPLAKPRGFASHLLHPAHALLHGRDAGAPLLHGAGELRGLLLLLLQLSFLLPTAGLKMKRAALGVRVCGHKTPLRFWGLRIPSWTSSVSEQDRRAPSQGDLYLYLLLLLLLSFAKFFGASLVALVEFLGGSPESLHARFSCGFQLEKGNFTIII